MFNICKLTLDDINELDNLGYAIELCKVNSYSKGQSTLYYNIDLDEIENTNIINIKDSFINAYKNQIVDIKNRAFLTEADTIYSTYWIYPITWILSAVTLTIYYKNLKLEEAIYKI